MEIAAVQSNLDIIVGAGAINGLDMLPVGGTNSVQQDSGVEEEMTVEDARDDSPAN